MLCENIVAGYLKKVAKLDSCKGDHVVSPSVSTEQIPTRLSYNCRVDPQSPSPTSTCPTIAQVLWKPLWPPGWHPRGSHGHSHHLFTKPIITMSSPQENINIYESCLNDKSVFENSFLDKSLLKKYEEVEAWLDEHPKFFCDYLVRKASRSLIDAWLLAHTVPHGYGSASAPTSGATTPVRKISAHEFEKGSLLLRPMVSTTQDGTPTFLPLSPEEEEGPKTEIRKSRHELEKLDEKQLIFELVKDICNDLDVVSLNYKILKNVSLLTNADRCSLFLVKGEKGDPNRHFVSTLFDVSSYSDVKERTEIIKVPWGQGIVGYVADSGLSVNIPDCYNDSRFSDCVDQLTGYKTSNMLCSPIFDNYGEVMGVAQVINKLSTTEKCFTANDERIFNQYLGFCGIGLRNAQLFERSQLENKRNQVLLDLARMVFEDQSTIEHIVYRIMVHTQSLLECERCQVLLIGDGENCDTSMTFTRVFDLEADDLNENRVQKSPCEGRFPINIGITGHVATTGETLNIANAYSDPRFDPLVDNDGSVFKHRSILCMPIKNAERKIIGVSQLVNKFNGSPFNKNDENLFEAFAIFFGMGIHNTQMYEKAMRAIAKQRVTFECLSYHATAKQEETDNLVSQTIPSTQSLHLSDLTFNDFGLGEDRLLQACIRMFIDLDLINRFRINYSVLCRWLLSVRKNYRPVIYHNWRHAFNVAQMMFAILTQTNMCAILGELETLALIVACLCHDLDHRGTNNSFQIKSSSPLAMLYSTSTMEHHHFDQSLMILNSPGNQILASLDEAEYKRVINVMEEAILATDLALYCANRDRFIEKIETLNYDWKDNDDRKLLRSMLMTGCDIAAITKPWEVQKVVAELVASEFFEQGDIEKEMKIKPIDMMDREKKDMLPKLQVSFINTICYPIYRCFAQLFPSLSALQKGVIENKKQWLFTAMQQKSLKDWATKELEKLNMDKNF